MRLETGCLFFTLSFFFMLGVVLVLVLLPKIRVRVRHTKQILFFFFKAKARWCWWWVREKERKRSQKLKGWLYYWLCVKNVKKCVLKKRSVDSRKPFHDNIRTWFSFMIFISRYKKKIKTLILLFNRLSECFHNSMLFLLAKKQRKRDEIIKYNFKSTSLTFNSTARTTTRFIELDIDKLDIDACVKCCIFVKCQENMFDNFFHILLI